MSGRLHTSGRIALAIIVALAALATFLMSSPASAQEEDDGVIPGCVNRYNGNLRVPRIAGQCASTEYAIEFTSKAGSDTTEQELLDRIQELEDELNTRIDGEVSTLNTRIDNEVQTINLRIDTEVSTLNSRIDGEVSTLNTRIDGEVLTLNTRIDGEVADINLRIDNEVTTLNGLIDALGSSFTDTFGAFTSCFNETFDFSLPLPDIIIDPVVVNVFDLGELEVFPGFDLIIPDINLTILDPVGVVNCLGNVDLNPND